MAVQQPAGKSYVGQDFFSYDVVFSTLTAGTSQTANIQCEVNSDFAWQKACVMADIAGGAETTSGQVMPLCTVVIQDSGSNRQFQITPTPVCNLFGFGYSPFILPNPRIFVARANISITIANYSAATNYGSVRLSFIGTKMFLAS